MEKWKQVAGDMSFDSVGCVLAKDVPKGRYVALVRITPWLEMDSAALKEGYGFWDVSTTDIDYDDMGLDNPNVKSALDYVGMEPAEYEKLEPSYKAEIIASSSGYDDSRSTSNFKDALPAPIHEISFWSGDASSKDLEQINESMRFEVISKLYGGKFRNGKLPDSDILEMAFGEEPRIFQISEDEAQAMRYATAVARNAFTWAATKKVDDTKLKIADTDELIMLLEALRDAPDSSGLPAEAITKLQGAYERTFNLDWENKREQTAYFIDEDAKEAKLLLDNLLSSLGF